MARNNQGLKKPKLGERTEVRTFAQKADSAAAFPLLSKCSLEPQKPQGTQRTHRVLLRRWLTGALSEYRVGFTGYLEKFHHGVWVCSLWGWLQVRSYQTNQLPCYLRAPVFLNQLPKFPVLLQKTTEFGIPQPRTLQNFILWCQWHKTPMIFQTG